MCAVQSYQRGKRPARAATWDRAAWAMPARPGRLLVTHYYGNIDDMSIAHSKVTSQGQISVPAKVRQRLGIGPGSILEWDEEGDRIIVRKAGRYTSADIHRSVFSTPPRPRSIGDMKDGVRRDIRRRRARR
jgi:AbrB family looped-hinge helix DNA binding protein